MKAKRFTEKQIIQSLNEAEQTWNIRDVCKRKNITETTFYRWRIKIGGMEISDPNWLRKLEQENSQLKRTMAAQAP